MSVNNILIHIDSDREALDGDDGNALSLGVEKHFARHGIEWGCYLGSTSRLLWRRDLKLTPKAVRRIIDSSPLTSVSMASQSKGCDSKFANDVFQQ